jgi:hypothetical protein
MKRRRRGAQSEKWAFVDFMKKQAPSPYEIRLSAKS